MPKIAVVVLADTESHGDMGRVANALELAKEAREKNDAVTLVFDGAGTKWVPALHDPSSKLAPLYNAVRDTVAGACAFCSVAFGVKEEVEQAGVPLLSEYDDHPSLRKLLADGYHVVTF